MATRNPIHPTSTVSEPVWENEKRISVRAIWEIAALAGNVYPSQGNINRKKNEEPAWKAGYGEIMRRMIDVLTHTTARDNNHINYDPALPFNAAIQAQGRSHRQTRVDVISACNFIAGRYGVDKLPEGMRTMLQSLESDVARNSAQFDLPIAQSEAAKKPTESKDQTKANETKKSILISTVLVAIATDLWGAGTVEEESPILESDIQAMLDKHKLTNVHGLKTGFVLDAIRAGKKHIQQKKV